VGSGTPSTELLTTAQVAAIYGVTKETVLNWVRADALPAVRTPGGGQFRFRRSDVERLLEPQPPKAVS
jgi:excisionase family DNA binding protein